MYWWVHYGNSPHKFVLNTFYTQKNPTNTERAKCLALMLIRSHFSLVLISLWWTGAFHNLHLPSWNVFGPVVQGLCFVITFGSLKNLKLFCLFGGLKHPYIAEFGIYTMGLAMLFPLYQLFLLYLIFTLFLGPTWCSKLNSKII